MLSFWPCLLEFVVCIFELNKGKVKIKKKTRINSSFMRVFPYDAGWLCYLECEFFLFGILSHQNRVAIL